MKCGLRESYLEMRVYLLERKTGMSERTGFFPLSREFSSYPRHSHRECMGMFRPINHQHFHKRLSCYVFFPVYLSCLLAVILRCLVRKDKKEKSSHLTSFFARSNLCFSITRSFCYANWKVKVVPCPGETRWKEKGKIESSCLHHSPCSTDSVTERPFPVLLVKLTEDVTLNWLCRRRLTDLSLKKHTTLTHRPF